MLDSDSSSSTDFDYNEVYSLFTKCDLEDVLVNTNKEPMTVKEECEAIQKLKSENFDLKIRYYLLKKDYNDLLSSENGKQINETNKNQANRKEASAKDKEIKVLRVVLEQRVKQLISLKNYYDEILRSKDLEIEELKEERTADYVTELQDNARALYDMIEQKDAEANELKEQINNQKNEIKKLKDELVDAQLSIEKINLNQIETTNQQSNEATNQQTETFRLSLEATRKELDKVKFELKNQRIIEKEKLENFAKLVTEKEVENDLLKDQIEALKSNLNGREIYLQKENDKLKEIEQLLIDEVAQLKEREEILLKENRDYELKFKEDYLIKKKEHLLKDEFDGQRSLDENDNPINVKDLIYYAQSLEKQLDFKDEQIRKNDIEKAKLMQTLNYLKEKKNNYEKIITNQLSKTNDLLKTAKMNLINKQS